MSDTDADLSRATFPWLRSGFDLEGYVGALAAWLVGILLGLLWAPLFWIGFIAAIVILLATRTAERTPPVGDGLLSAPCDGMVVAISGANPPSELRLEGGGWTRVRVSVGPTKSNGIYAPMDGAVDHIIRETGDPSAFAAMKVDRPGLAAAFVSFESGDRATGLRLATGGLGPRLEIASEPGDAVRLGRNIGTLRLGGWCDIYVPSGARIEIRPGQTLIGAETVLARFDGGMADLFETQPAEDGIVPTAPLPVDDDAERFFESEIRPILVDHCIACHGESDQNGGLRLDSRTALLKGGDSGPAAVPEVGDESLLIAAVTRSEDLAMPPDDPLSKSQVAALTKWVSLGLPWPNANMPLRNRFAANAEQHWAFQPVAQSSVPNIADSSRVRNPIDAFILHKLADSKLTPSPQADGRTLIRRLFYSLTGLPPSQAEVSAFVNQSPDTADDAYADCV